jgi:Right handed beta helix region
MMQTIDCNYTQPPKGDFIMSKVRFTLNILAVAIFTLTVSSLANAQATRTWVSGVGDDVNPCSRTAPCKTFAGAISKTATDGEISVLDPGGFGAITITKSITINGTKGAGYGSISAALSTGVIVNNASANVRLRSIDVNGMGNGVDGIRIHAAARVYIEDCVFSGFTNRGINDIRNTVGGQLYVSDTTVRQTTQSGLVVIPTAPGTVTAVIDNSRVQGSTANSGIVFSGAVKGIINRSVVAGHAAAGLFADGSSEMTVSDSVVSHNATGINVAAPGVVRLLNSTLSNNTVSIPVAGQPQVQSNGNNTFTANATNNLPTGPGISSN